jgi:hypothetical protein
MALPEDVREKVEWKLALYCERRIPCRVRDQIQLGYRFRGNSVTLFERRPALLEPGVWTEFAVAQFRLDPKTLLWTLYWRDRNGRWHWYDEVDTTPDLADLLHEVDDDPTCIFWG